MTRTSKFNFIFITGLAIFLLAWWALIHFAVTPANTHAKIFWSSSSVLLLLIGAYFGFVVWRKNEIGKLRNSVLVFSFGVAAQAIANLVFCSVNYILSSSNVYPSVADIFYYVANVLYLVGIILVAKQFWRSHFVAILLWSVIFAVLIFFIDLKILFLAHFSFSWEAEPLTDMGYIIVESFSTMVALGITVATRFFKGHTARAALLFFVAGVCLQFFMDFNYLYSNHVSSWDIGGFGDVVYLFAYYPMSAAIILFLNTPVAVEILVIALNTILFIQFYLASKSDRFISDAVVFLLGCIISMVLFRRNRFDVRSKEDVVRFAALEESNDKLKSLDKQKTEFLNIAAHQLRTPASIINNYISMLQDGDYGAVSAEAKEVLDNIGQSNQWLVRLADEFLNISNIESGQTKFHVAAGDLGRAVREVVFELKPKAEQKGLTLNFVEPTENLQTHFDEEKIKHVILNLIENAVKYTPEGTVTVGVVKENNGVSVSVADTGIGFTTEESSKFFQKFQRGINASQIEVNTSTGLGLYIARKFVEGHGGKVWAQSEGQGKGSEFGFWIPLSPHLGDP